MEVIYIEIGGQQYSQVVVTGKDGDVLAVISDEEAIEKDGYKVALDLA